MSKIDTREEMTIENRGPVTDKEAHWAELVLRAINDLDAPMLVFEAEKQVVKHGLEMLLEAWRAQKAAQKE